MTSTVSIVVDPFNPCKPFRVVDTFTAMLSSVIWPILRFATARDVPTKKKSATFAFVNSVSTSASQDDH